ncbi:UNVERIFIED_CONTAM: hypothetical protein RMT77_017374 [Armadillidium vulgare]
MIFLELLHFHQLNILSQFHTVEIALCQLNIVNITRRMISCKQWLEKNLPEEFEKLSTEGENKSEDCSDEKKRQKRGGKGMVKAKKKEDVQKKITVFVAPRGKKRLTVVVGLKTFDIDLKSAAKHFGTKFACGSSVTGDDEIVIQGDIKDDLIDHIPEKWTEIDDDSIEDGGEHKR